MQKVVNLKKKLYKKTRPTLTSKPSEKFIIKTKRIVLNVQIKIQ